MTAFYLDFCDSAGRQGKCDAVIWQQQQVRGDIEYWDPQGAQKELKNSTRIQEGVILKDCVKKYETIYLLYNWLSLAFRMSTTCPGFTGFQISQKIETHSGLWLHESTPLLQSTCIQAWYPAHSPRGVHRLIKIKNCGHFVEIMTGVNWAWMNAWWALLSPLLPQMFPSRKH